MGEQSGEKSGKKKGKKSGKEKTVKKDCKNEGKPFEESLSGILGLLEIEAEGRNDGAELKEKVDLLSGQVEVVLSDNKELEARNKELEARVEVVLADNKELEVRVEVLEARVEVVLADNQVLKVRMMEQNKAFEESRALVRSVRLRIALEAAHTQLTADLRREPGDSTWKEFINSITPTEKASLLEKVSTKALDLMSTGKRKLNRYLHTGPTADIALAVTSMQDQQEAWIDVFKYAYKVDPKQVVFGDE